MAAPLLEPKFSYANRQAMTETGPAMRAKGTGQPLLGLAGTALTVPLCLLFAGLLPVHLVDGWIGAAMTACVPALIVQTVAWPDPLAGKGGALAAPLRGLSMVDGAVVAIGAVWLLNGGEYQATPFVMLPLICSVPVTLWLVFPLDCWPFARLGRSPLLLGAAILTTVYALTFLFDVLLANYRFLAGAPVYSDVLDPGGMADARDAVAVLLGAADVTLALVAFDYWPITAWKIVAPVTGRQPWRGIVAIITSLVIAACAWFGCVRLGGMEVAVYQARICVSFIFGIFVLLVLFEGQAFADRPQPVKGLLTCCVAALIAVLAYEIYHIVAVDLAGADARAPGHSAEIWISTVMLTITFPAMSIFADLFGFWPLAKANQARRQR